MMTPHSSVASRLRLRPRSALHSELVERLRDDIVAGVLPSGADINERQLCEVFEVSRTPLREALLLLAAEGLIEMVPRRGARVMHLSSAEVRDLLELLGGLEGLAGDLAAARATAGEIEVIRAKHAEMLARYAERNMLAYFKLNEQIHDLIVASAHNDALARQHGLVRNRVLRSLYVPNMSSERWAHAVEEHEGFVRALGARDGDALSAALRTHKRNTWQELRRLRACGTGGEREQTS